MTDTPDALINEHALALHEHNEAFDMRDEDALIDAHKRVNDAAQTLRARLTAGDAAIADKKIIGDTLAATVIQLNDTQAELDAAIKRVAELNEAVELLRQDHAAMNARLVAALDDLAAARAEIERKDAALRICITRIEQPNMSPDANYVVEIARAALAPKETNNG